MVLTKLSGLALCFISADAIKGFMGTTKLLRTTPATAVIAGDEPDAPLGFGGRRLLGDGILPFQETYGPLGQGSVGIYDPLGRRMAGNDGTQSSQGGLGVYDPLRRRLSSQFPEFGDHRLGGCCCDKPYCWTTSDHCCNH